MSASFSGSVVVASPEVLPLDHVSLVPSERRSGPLPTRSARRRYWLTVIVLVVMAVGFAFGLLAYNNPMPVGSDGFWKIAKLRATSVTVMAIVAFCQGLSTVSFQTAVGNRIVTPSIMGFESLYVAIQTSTVYFFGVASLIAFRGLSQFAFQIVVMVGLSLLLYGWLLSGKFANLQVMLLIGIVIGGGLRSVSTFMQRMLTPSAFDILSARLFGNVSNADPDTFPLAIPLVVIASILLWFKTKQLNLLGLGREMATGLGIDYRRELIQVLFLVSILMAVSTALVGPMTFLGFLVATLSYQMTSTYDHRFIFPITVLTTFTILSGAYFVMRHIFYAQGTVSIIIEAVGGSVFLIVMLRKGRL